MRPSRIVLSVALVGALHAARAAEPDPGATDRRAEIAAQRAEVNKRYAEQEQACQQRFVVTSCLNGAREQRRAALAPLRQEELRIDTEERKQRAAARLGEIEAKERAEATRDAASATPSERAASSAPPAPSRPADRIGGGAPKPAISAEERARREAASEAKFDRQQEEADKHRAAVAARNAERLAKGKVAKPLPPAAGASAP